MISQKQAGFDLDVEETGSTFADNALIKVRAICKALNCIVIGDDSGLCVEALDGAPGVYSARYSGQHGNDKANRELLLKNMQNVENRKAYFACAVAMAFPDGKEFVAEGRAQGQIMYEEKGDGGFGYDSLFFSEELKKSFAEATPSEKNAVSHRAKALAKLRMLINGQNNQ